jgi:hypothetical protein
MRCEFPQALWYGVKGTPKPTGMLLEPFLLHRRWPPRWTPIQSHSIPGTLDQLTRHYLPELPQLNINRTGGHLEGEDVLRLLHLGQRYLGLESRAQLTSKFSTHDTGGCAGLHPKCHGQF